jgi:TonB family protein
MKPDFPDNSGAWVPEFVHHWVNQTAAVFMQAVRHKNYDYLFRRSVAVSILLLLFAALFSELFKEEEVMELFGPQRQLLSISRHTLVVVNAVARTSLAKRRIKVPKYKPTELALTELDIPEPELGSIDIGPDVPVDQGPSGPGSPDGQARVRRPELLMLVPPIYPKDAEKKKIQGTVNLRIHVTTLGTVDQVEIINSSGLESMDKAAVKAAQKTRFRPAIKDGQRVPMWISYPIQFALNQK